MVRGRVHPGGHGRDEPVIKLDDLTAATGATKAMVELYVALGLLPKPVVGRDGETTSARVFPSGATARIRTIDALRKQGLNLVDISLKLRDEPLPAGEDADPRGA